MNETPEDMLDAYVRAFESQSVDEVVPFYALPCTFIRPDGTWVVQDEATARVLVQHLIDHAKGQGYRKSEVPDLAVRTLAPELAELTGVFVRRSESDAEVARFGFTYLVRRGEEGWKIIVAAAHLPQTDTIVRRSGQQTDARRSDEARERPAR